jgi:hypothetical protein
MEYIIVRDNSNDLKPIEYLDTIENIDVPSIPIDIIEMFKNDYEFIAKLLEYKRDATLSFLKIYNTLNVFENNFNLKIEKEIKNFWEFFVFLKNTAKMFTIEGKNFFETKNENRYNNNFQLIDEKLLGPIIEKIFDKIYHCYLAKFPYWNDNKETQSDYININLKNKTDINNIRYYWNFQGIISVQDTNYGKLINGVSFKVKFSGAPQFQIVSFDLNLLKYFKKIEKNLKQYIDKVDDKIISQNLKNFQIDLDF